MKNINLLFVILLMFLHNCYQPYEIFYNKNEDTNLVEKDTLTLKGTVIQFTPNGISPLSNANVKLVSDSFSIDTLTNLDGKFVFMLDSLPETCQFIISKEGYTSKDTIINSSTFIQINNNEYVCRDSFMLKKIVNYFPTNIINTTYLYNSKAHDYDWESYNSIVTGLELWEIKDITPDSNYMVIDIMFDGTRYISYYYGSYTIDIDSVHFIVLMENKGKTWKLKSYTPYNVTYEIAGIRILKKFGIPYILPYSGLIFTYTKKHEFDIDKWKIKYSDGYIYGKIEEHYPYFTNTCELIRTSQNK